MKKVFTNLIVLICAIACVIGLAACEGKHNWSAEWSSNDSNHWHDCTDENCKKRQDITPHDWQLDFAENPATCLDSGWGQYSCAVCGRTKEDTIPATGHNWQIKKEEVEIQPTCITPGRGTYFCTECGIEETKRVIPPTGIHPFAETWSCDERGHYHSCTTKGCVAISEIIPHVEGGVKVEQPSTSSANENYYDKFTQNFCKVCNFVMSEKTGLSPLIPVSFKPVIKKGATEIPIDASNHVILERRESYEFSFVDGVNEDGEPVNNIPLVNDGSGVQYNIAHPDFDYNGVYIYQVIDEGSSHHCNYDNGNLHKCYWLLKQPGFFNYEYPNFTSGEVSPGEYQLLLRFEIHNVWKTYNQADPYLRYGGEVLLYVTVI